MSKLLSFKQPDRPAPAPLPERWQVGIDRQHAILYMLIALITGFTAGFALARYTQKPAETFPAPETARPQQPGEATADFHAVTKIIRGDTIEVESIGQVRLIGVETPDGKSQYAQEGKNTVAFVQKLLSAQSVRIETDEAYSARQNKDAEGRTLGYVYLKDGTMLNLELLKQGHAFLRVGEPFRMEEDFRAAERGAMRSLQGIWGNGQGGDNLAREETKQDSQPDKPKKGAPLAPSDIGPNIPALATASPSEPMVFISGADKLYHRQECETPGKKKSALPLSQAKAAGHTPCGRCYASTVLKAP